MDCRVLQIFLSCVGVCCSRLSCLQYIELGFRSLLLALTEKLLLHFSQQKAGTLFGMFNMFSGGALENFSIFALGIMPYISSSIIIQLLTVVIPQLEALKKEGQSGQRKITQYTRYGTVLLSIIQGTFIAVGLQGMTGPGGEAIVLNPGIAVQIDDDADPHLRHRLYHVAWRTDDGKGNWQRHLTYHLRRNCCTEAQRQLSTLFN